MKTEKILGYEVHRKKVKNINLRIKENMEIYISAPENLHSDYIKNFLISKEKWIKNVLKKLEKIKEERKEKEYITGEIHNFLGQKYILTVKNGNFNRVALKNDKKNTDLNSDNNPFDFVLYLYLPSNSYFLNAKFFLRKAWKN